MILRAMMTGSLAKAHEFGMELTDKLQRWAPRAIDPGDVHVRTFLAAHSRPSRDEVLRIREGAIKKMARLYPGAPVLRNHGGAFGMSAEDMPIARVFDAGTRAADDKAEELLLSFYSARGDEMGDRVARYVDLGLWMESSIHARFGEGFCSICGKTMDDTQRNCCSEHELGTEYDGEMARLELDAPLETPEFSLVWSGRLVGTRALAREIPGTMTVAQFARRRHSWLETITGRKPGGNGWLRTVAAARG